jgi:hypothetical protein
MGKSGIYEAASAKRIAAVLRHEYGHALNTLLNASESPAFVAACADDASVLAAWLTKLLAVEAGEWRYLMRLAPAGRAETFAELFAELHGGGTTTFLNVSSAMPKSLAIARAIIKALKKGQP